MKIPRCVRSLGRFFGFAAVLCLFAGAGYGQHFTGYDLIVPESSTPNAVTTVDGTGITLPTGRSYVIGIEGGLRNPIKFINWTGSADFPIMIVNKHGTGRVEISDAVPGVPGASGATGIYMQHCKYLKLRGDNDPTYRYGIEISRAGGAGSGSGPRGVDVTGKSSYVEISHLEIHNIAFAGIMVKQDPSGTDFSLNHPQLKYYDIKIHDNYIYNIGGEGMYIGYSKWAENRNETGLEFSHNIIGLRIYNNLLEECDWDGIQVGAATADVAVHDNVIYRSGGTIDTGAPGNGGQGIQIGEGTTGLWYNNMIIQSRTNGISLIGIGNDYVFNNLIVCPREGVDNFGLLGLFADNRPGIVPAGQPPERQTQAGTPYYVFHNTVIGPAKRAFWTMSEITDNLFNNNIAVTSATTDPFVLLDIGVTADVEGNVFQADDSGLEFAAPAQYDYRILNTSVARNAGVSGLEMPDFVSIARPQNGASDAGYSESGALSVFLRTTPPTSGNNGSIDAAAINGTAPYTYLWSDGNTTNPRTGLAPGHYSVVVTDAAGAKQKCATYLFAGATLGAPVTFTPLTQVEAPTFNAPSGTYPSAQSVTLTSATSGATIRYTVDGTTPTDSHGTVYSSPVSVTATGTLKAVAYKAGLTDSAVSVATYFIGVAPAAPQLNVTEVADRKISLGWTVPGGANRFELKYATTSGGPYTSLGVVTGTGYTHTGLSNGTTYYYVIQASNVYGTGPVSAQVSATPFGFYATLSILSGLTAGPAVPPSPTASGVFNAQPSWDTVNLVPVGSEPNNTDHVNVSGGTNKCWYIDFGTNYSSYHIMQMWTRFRPNSSGAHAGFGEVWWDDETDTTNDGITASTMNFGTATALPNSNAQLWNRDRDFSASPITPPSRYLMFRNIGSGPSKPNEFAFVGGQDGAPAAPTFSQHPQSQAVSSGSEVSLTATASGSPAPTFQWRKNGVNIAGATGQVLTLTNVQSADAGSYSVVATNASGSATSSNATLTVSGGGGTPTWVILTPGAVGTATGSASCTAAGAFNEQPTWDVVNGVPTGIAASPHATTTTAYTNRFWFIDFGANYASLRITQMWTRYRPYSSGNHPGFAQMWWDDDKDMTNDGVTASTMNFGNGQGLPSISSQIWVRDRDFTSAPIAPQGRYLVVSTGAAPGDRPNEFAFVGYVIP